MVLEDLSSLVVLLVDEVRDTVWDTVWGIFRDTVWVTVTDTVAWLAPAVIATFESQVLRLSESSPIGCELMVIGLVVVVTWLRRLGAIAYGGILCR